MFLQYGLAAGSSTAALGLRLLLESLLGYRLPYAAFYLASLLSAWFGGLGPGLLAMALGALAGAYFFAAPGEPLPIAGSGGRGLLVLYLFLSLAGILLLHVLRRAKQAALRNAALAEERLEQWRSEALQRNEAQEKLQRTEQQFALFMRHLPGAAWIKDAQGRYLYVNENGEQIFQRTAEELRGRTDAEIFPAETAAEFAANDRLALASGQCHQTVEALAQKDGVHYSIVHKFPIRGDDGRAALVGGIAFDITGRLRAEEELRRSQQQLRTILESISDGFVALDREWRYTYVNREAARQAGLRPEEMLGRKIWEILPPGADSRFRAELERAVQECVPASFEIAYPGYQRWFRIHAYPSEEGLSVFAVEITAQKEAEATRAVLAGIVESCDDAILAQTVDGVVTSWNPAAERLYGYAAAEMLGRPISLLIPADRRAEFEGIRERVRRGERLDNFETVRLRKDGEPVEVAVTVSPLREPDGAIIGWSTIARNITEKKKLEQHLRQVQKLESLGVLAGGIAHDFNNLLTCVLGNASLASCETAPDTPAAHRLKEVVLATERMADLTRQMLAYAGKGQFLLERLDCSEKVREIGSLVRASVPSNVQLRLKLEPGLPVIEADPGQFHQVVINLITNAAEAIGEHNGAVWVRTRLERVDEEYLRTAPLVLGGIAPGEYVCVEVEDTGCGMDQEVRARIFDPFFTTKFTGRGLGLSAALGIIRGHGGALELHSTPRQGSCFRVLFPVVRERAVVRRAAASAGDLAGAGLVLVVDDEEIIRTTARAALEQYGYTVIVAEHGRAALRVLELFRGQVMLVLLDMTMPVMGGVETLKEIKRLFPSLPVVASTGYSEAEAKERFGQESPAGFIQKPYTPARLAGVVKKILASRTSAAA